MHHKLAMSDEKNTKNKLSKAFKEAGIFYYNTHDTYRAGVPDMYAAYGGQSYWLELKRMRGDKMSHPLTMQQAAFLTDVNRAGACGLMVVEDDDGQIHSCRIEEIQERTTCEAAQIYAGIGHFVDAILEGIK